MVTPGTPDPGTPPSDAPDAAKPIETDVPPPPDMPPLGTTNLHLAYGSDETTNHNLDLIDAAIGALQAATAPATK